MPLTLELRTPQTECVQAEFFVGRERRCRVDRRQRGVAASQECNSGERRRRTRIDRATPAPERHGLKGFEQAGVNERPIASEQTVHAGGARSHLPDDGDRRNNRPVENFRMLSPQAFGADSRRHDPHQLTVSDGSAERIERRLVAQRCAEPVETIAPRAIGGRRPLALDRGGNDMVGIERRALAQTERPGALQPPRQPRRPHQVRLRRPRHRREASPIKSSRRALPRAPVGDGPTMDVQCYRRARREPPAKCLLPSRRPWR